MKKLFFVLLSVVILAGCGAKTTGEAGDVSEPQLISELVSNPVEFDNHTVTFEGTIGHICRNSGDKMRVVQQDDDAYSILVMLGEMASSFNPEMEGHHVVATGVLKTEVRNIDQLAEEHEHGEGEEGHGCASTEEAIAKLKEKGISADIRVYVELTSFEVK